MHKSNFGNPLLANRMFLYITEFFSGLTIMAVELGASRLLAPYFSSSQVVWTIIIGTIMIAIALGNLYGGRAADKNPNPNRLYFRIIIAALWLALVPVVSKFVINVITKGIIVSISNNFLIVATFVACFLLFVFPLFLLGTVTPSLVKYTVNDLSKNGTIVGRLYAYNTIGCIIGTFIPTFVSIPIVGTSISFLIFSGVLLVISIIYFTVELISLKRIKNLNLMIICLSVVVFIGCCIAVFANNSITKEDIVYEGDSVYNYLLVRDSNSFITLATNAVFGVQSVHNKTNNLTGGYYDYDLAAAYMADVYNKKDFDILVLGNATGTYASLCQQFFGKDKVNIDGVEIDEKITELGKEYFDMPDNINTYNYDGRAYLDATDKKYDVIMVDAYQDLMFPFQMSTVEFFERVRQHLKEDGVMVANVCSPSETEENFQQYLPDTISSVFPNVLVTKLGRSINSEVFASNNPNAKRLFDENLKLENNDKLFMLMQKMSDSFECHTNTDYILTDDKAPVELIWAKNLAKYLKSSF